MGALRRKTGKPRRKKPCWDVTHAGETWLFSGHACCSLTLLNYPKRLNETLLAFKSPSLWAFMSAMMMSKKIACKQQSSSVSFKHFLFLNVFRLMTGYAPCVLDYITHLDSKPHLLPPNCLSRPLANVFSLKNVSHYTLTWVFQLSEGMAIKHCVGLIHSSILRVWIWYLSHLLDPLWPPGDQLVYGVLIETSSVCTRQNN